MPKTQTKRPKAFSYIRWSTPDQSAGDSLRRQTEAARRYATANGLDLDEGPPFKDGGVSAHHGRNVEAGGALAAFLVAVREGRVSPGSFLLVESLDRISRQTVRLAVRTLESIVEMDITVVDLSDNGRAYSVATLDSDPFAFVMMALRFIRSHEESAMKGVRVAAAYEKKRANAAAGQETVPFTRMLPAWLRYDDQRKACVALPDRAKIVKEIFKRADAGDGQHSIAHWLNQKGVKPWGKGARWHRSYVRKILTNAAVVGTFTPHRAMKIAGGARQRKPLDPIENYWPAVIDRALFERVSSRIAAGGAPKGPNASRPIASIFAGTLWCAHCASRVVRVAKGSHVYLCCGSAHARGGCKYQAVPYAAVESAFLENADTICARAPAGDAVAAQEAELQSLEDGLHELYQDKEVLVDELTATRSDAVRRRLHEVEMQIEEGERRARELRKLIEARAAPYAKKRIARLRAILNARPLDVAAVNATLKETLDRIVMNPEAGALDIAWRHAPESSQTVRFTSRHLRDFEAVAIDAKSGM